jgi:hypothetical protein
MLETVHNNSQPDDLLEVFTNIPNYLPLLYVCVYINTLLKICAFVVTVHSDVA